MTPRWRLALVSAFGAILLGCAWVPPPQTAALRAQGVAARASAVTEQPAAPEADTMTLRGSMPSVWPRVLLAEVPFFPDRGYFCGPATLAALLGAAGVSTTPEALVPQVVLPARQGSLQTELLAAARRAGLLAVVLPPRLDAVLAEVSAGRPVGVLLNLGFSWWPQWHYATVIGHDVDREELILHSGAERAQRWPFTTFEHTWARADHWAIAVTRPGVLPATAQRAAVEQAVVALERLVPPDAAGRAWQSVLQRWPDSWLAAMGMGNADYAQSRWAAAAARFEMAAQQHRSAAAFNNLALARQHLGDRPAARAAALAAWAMVSDDTGDVALRAAVKDTLDGLGGLSGP